MNSKPAVWWRIAVRRPFRPRASSQSSSDRWELVRRLAQAPGHLGGAGVAGGPRRQRYQVRLLSEEHQRFHSLGRAEYRRLGFTAGELRYEESGTAGLIAWADTNGDAVADFSIRFHGLASITGSAFTL